MNTDGSGKPPEVATSALTGGALPLSILQVHVTERCNKKCAHCYQEDSGFRANDMSLDHLLSVVSSFGDICRSRQWKGQVTFAGGEPFIRRDFMQVLREMGRWPFLKFAILTNGTYIDPTTASELKEIRPVFVQISLEGGPNTHDRIRGAGDFVRCLKVLSILKRAGVRTLVSFTAHRSNYHEFPVVAQYAREAGTGALWADRLVPMGRGSQLETLSPVESQIFFDLMYKERLKTSASSPTKIVMRRALQFLCGGEYPYRCAAGKRLLAVLPDGTVYPCRRLPIPLGNFLTTPLEQMYEKVKSIGDQPSGCRHCEHLMRCNGGAKCIAYAAYGNLSEADPGCWLAHGRESCESSLCHIANSAELPPRQGGNRLIKRVPCKDQSA